MIELLVVLAILGILAAVLFPVFAHVREKARQTTCASNLHQIGLATMQYVGDNDETMFPKAYDDDAGGRVDWSYYVTPGPHKTIDKSRGLLGAYLKSDAVWVCPSADLKQVGTNKPSSYPTYGLNSVLHGNRLHPASSLPQVEIPSETILAADSGRPNPGSGVTVADYILPTSRHNPFVCGRHSGLAEVLWLDGHVNARKPATAYQDNYYSNVATQLQDHLGNILKGPYTGNAQTDDYYYELVKPTGR